MYKYIIIFEFYPSLLHFLFYFHDAGELCLVLTKLMAFYCNVKFCGLALSAANQPINCNKSSDLNFAFSWSHRSHQWSQSYPPQLIQHYLLTQWRWKRSLCSLPKGCNYYFLSIFLLVKDKIQNMTFSLSVKPKSTWDSLRRLPASFHSVIQSKGPCRIQLKGILAKDQFKETSNKYWSIDETQKAFCLLLHDPITKKASPIWHIYSLPNIQLNLHIV